MVNNQNWSRMANAPISMFQNEPFLDEIALLLLHAFNRRIHSQLVKMKKKKYSLKIFDSYNRNCGLYFHLKLSSFLYSYSHSLLLIILPFFYLLDNLFYWDSLFYLNWFRSVEQICYQPKFRMFEKRRTNEKRKSLPFVFLLNSSLSNHLSESKIIILAQEILMSFVFIVLLNCSFSVGQFVSHVIVAGFKRFFLNYGVVFYR